MREEPLSRRGFLYGLAAASGAALFGSPAAGARPRPFFQEYDLPLGVQLYTLLAEANRDLDGALAQLAAIGYHSVELFGLTMKPPKEMRAALDRAGMTCPSAHVMLGGGRLSLSGDLDAVAEAAATIGATALVVPAPITPELARRGAAAGGKEGVIAGLAAALTADDFHRIAETLNDHGRRLAGHGIRLGYHNHAFEFAPKGGSNGFEILAASSDPKHVDFEIDVGWVAAAGHDPLDLLRRHSGRFRHMHVKDIKATTRPSYLTKQDSAEVGSGTLDWASILAAAYEAGVRNFFVEQEPPFSGSAFEAVAKSYAFLQTLRF